jgi:hypothetical protein
VHLAADGKTIKNATGKIYIAAFKVHKCIK